MARTRKSCRTRSQITHDQKAQENVHQSRTREERRDERESSEIPPASQDSRIRRKQLEPIYTVLKARLPVSFGRRNRGPRKAPTPLSPLRLVGSGLFTLHIDLLATDMMGLRNFDRFAVAQLFVAAGCDGIYSTSEDAICVLVLVLVPCTRTWHRILTS